MTPDTLTPGPEMDAAVAELVGAKRLEWCALYDTACSVVDCEVAPLLDICAHRKDGPYPPYSTDRAIAVELLDTGLPPDPEEPKSLWLLSSDRCRGDQEYECQIHRGKRWYVARASTIAWAVCQTVLEAFGETKGENA